MGLGSALGDMGEGDRPAGLGVAPSPIRGIVFML